MKTFKVRSKVWLYPGMAGWHFVSLAKKQSEEIKKKFGAHTRGWGSIPVAVALGKSKWKTSIFPDKKAGVYILPLKAAVRAKEGVAYDDVISFTITLQI